MLSRRQSVSDEWSIPRKKRTPVLVYISIEIAYRADVIPYIFADHVPLFIPIYYFFQFWIVLNTTLNGKYLRRRMKSDGLLDFSSIFVKRVKKNYSNRESSLD